MNQRWAMIVGAVIVAAVAFVVVTRMKPTHSGPVHATSQEAQQLFDQAQTLEKEGKKTEARDVYQHIINDHPDFDRIEESQKQLSDLNIQVIFSNTQTPQTVMHQVQSGDSLGKIAKQYGTTMDLIKRSNNLKSDVIRVGQQLRIWTGKFSIYVNKSQNLLILKSGNDVVKVYHVSTGENNSTPVGTFKIVTKLVDPVWFKSGAIIPPESPANVLGSRWMGFDLAGYGIHGTTDPDKIGQQVTAGCVRMRNEDVEELYTMVPVGTQVTIAD